MNKLKLEGDFYFFRCPNCLDEIIVHNHELNCRIFRHAIMKDTYVQVDPHLSKVLCDKLIEENKVIGCCKPFEIVYNIRDGYNAIICDYK